MFILLFLIALIMMILTKKGKSPHSDLSCLLEIVLVISIIGIFWNMTLIVDGRAIEDKITMYEEENEKIENDIENLVSEYMIHESKTFSDLKTESSIELVTLYPDLKSDKLVKNQIRVYRENNDKLKNLKEKQINVKVAKWWLYFGK